MAEIDLPLEERVTRALSAARQQQRRAVGLVAQSRRIIAIRDADEWDRRLDTALPPACVPAARIG